MVWPVISELMHTETAALEMFCCYSTIFVVVVQLQKKLLQPLCKLGLLSSEISDGKFLEIYSNLSRNLFITYLNQLFPSTPFQSDVVK